MKDLVTLHPFRPKIGHKVDHLTICNVIKICLNADFANKKLVLVSEGLVNQVLAVYFKTSQTVRPSVCSDLVLRFSPPFMSAATLRARYTGFLAMKKNRRKSHFLPIFMNLGPF